MKLIDKNSSEILQNSSLLLGESVFTSLLCLNGRFIFLKCHLERLKLGVNFLFNFEIENDFSNQIEHELEELLRLSLDKTFSLRITFTKEGYFFSKRNWNEKESKSIVLQIGKSIKAPSIRPSFLKLSNYALERKELSMNPNIDDLVFLDSHQNITETTTSNIFLRNSEDTILTPELSSMILDGVLRKNIIKFLKQSNITVEERVISKQEMIEAKEMWITNSIKGIRKVSHLDKINYTSFNTYQFLTEKFGLFGEKFYE